MKHYQAWMDSQTLSPAAHARLVALADTPPAKRPAPWGRWAALAACAALVLGLGVYGLNYVNSMFQYGYPPGYKGADHQVALPSDPPGYQSAPTVDPDPGDTQPDLSGSDDALAFVAQGPEDSAKLMFPAIFAVDYPDAAGAGQISASIALPDGSFRVTLDKEAITRIFWGEDGKPAVTHPKTDPGDFPLFLMNWAGYTITGQVIYDGQGDLWELTLRGEKGEDSFTLRAAPGHLPLTDCILLGPQHTATDVLGTEVTGWHLSYDRDGDGEMEHEVTSQLMVGGYGVEFENVGAGGARASETNGGDATDLGGAMEFNAMLVNQLCRTDGGLYLDHIAHTDAIPAWREEAFGTLDAARAEAGFAPYLPTAAPEGYGEFYGRLSYQEGATNELWVRWDNGYDTVEVDVHLPEGTGSAYFADQLVDITIPESYDWRLYTGSIADSVPEEYRAHFYKPAFRAEDMSLDIVLARMTDKDTGGQACRFYVLHENGVVVSYDCSGVSAQYVWSLVEPTL